MANVSQTAHLPTGACTGVALHAAEHDTCDMAEQVPAEAPLCHPKCQNAKVAGRAHTVRRAPRRHRTHWYCMYRLTNYIQ